MEGTRLEFREYATAAFLGGVDGLLAQAGASELSLTCEEIVGTGSGAPLAQRYDIGGSRSSDRFGIMPVEGWDGTPDGGSTEHHHRRWAHSGRSGATLICGGKAVAVRHDGRANSCAELPQVVRLTGAAQENRICRTSGDCTTALRNGISGCRPLDPFYKKAAEARQPADVKAVWHA